MRDIVLMGRLAAALAEANHASGAAADWADYEDAPSDLESATRGPAADADFSDAAVAALISEEAFSAVIAFEVTGEAAYRRLYERPIAPGGDSGITVGIGYDLGYNEPARVQTDFKGLCSDRDIERLVAACGLKGDTARARLAEFRDVRVPWDVALEVFRRSTVPRFGRQVIRTFPRSTELHPHAFGALFSLVYNRGSSLSGDRRREMLAIRDAIVAGDLQRVPGFFRDMKRLWLGKRDVGGLVGRREAEAVLFERGLEAMAGSVVVASAATADTSAALERATPGDLARLDGDGDRYVEHDIAVRGDLESDAWSAVTWAKDDRSPDYHHFAKTNPGRVFEFAPDDLEALFEANQFVPDRAHGRIVFALRGAELVSSVENASPVDKQEARTALTLKNVRPNHQNFRCITGVYDLDRRLLSAFPSSTVPNRKAVTTYFKDQSSGNMMPTGCYRFEVGWHLASKPERRIPGCLIENGRQKCVLRSTNDRTYDLDDGWENHRLHGDNLHPAKREDSAEFSSWGCLVVRGNFAVPDGAARENGTHTGEWALFRKALGLAERGTSDHGKIFDVVVLTGEDALLASTARAEGSAAKIPGTPWLRQGSRGPYVQRLATALGRPATPVMDHALVKALTDYQRKMLGWADGIYTSALDATWGFKVFEPLPSVVARLERSPTTDTKITERTALWYEIGAHAAAARYSGLQNTHERLGAAHLEMGFGYLTTLGGKMARDMERALHDTVCGAAQHRLVGGEDVKSSIDAAARRGTEYLKEALIAALALTPAGWLPHQLLSRVVDGVLDSILAPVTGQAGQAAAAGLDGGVAWICRRWADRIDGGNADPSVAQAPVTHAGTPPAPAFTPTAPAPTPPAAAAPGSGPVAASALLDRLAATLATDQPNMAAVRRMINDLRRHSRDGVRLTAEESARLLDLICDASVIDSVPGALAADPSALIGEIRAAAAARPVRRADLSARARDLHALLADARIKVATGDIRNVLDALRMARCFEELTLLSERFAAREPDRLGLVANYYAQGLIDTGRVTAGLGVLRTAELDGKSTAPETVEALGLVGRAHKQIYVNHIRSTGDAMALAGPFGARLRAAVEAYGRVYESGEPATTYHHGVNFVALLRRAELDGIDLGQKPKAASVAKRLIETLEPAVATTDDPWLLASLGEAYLAIGNVDRAAERFASYARRPDVGAFALAGTIRQLEEVWRIEGGPSGAGAILLGLKAALADVEDGKITLSAAERASINRNPTSTYRELFESRTEGGKFIRLQVLKRIVDSAAAVAAIQEAGRSHATIGTGFLVKGSEFSPKLEPDRSYLLTNAHVLWDPAFGQGSEDGALAPPAAQIVFESAQLDGRPDVYLCSRVVWQSPSSLHDATLIELDRRVDGITPLTTAPREARLVPDTQSGTKLAVVGHPEGGPLSVSLSGSIEEMQATLVDRGPRAASGDPEFLHYRTPTEPGNSGSPVFEVDNWTVVGLHHAGFHPQQGRPKLGGKAGSNFANEGIWIDSIRKAVADHVRKNRKGWFGA